MVLKVNYDIKFINHSLKKFKTIVISLYSKILYFYFLIDIKLKFLVVGILITEHSLTYPYVIINNVLLNKYHVSSTIFNLLLLSNLNSHFFTAFQVVDCILSTLCRYKVY